MAIIWKIIPGCYINGKNLYVIKLAGIQNRNQAEELGGCKLMVPASDRPQLGEDEYHVRFDSICRSDCTSGRLAIWSY